MSFTFYPIAGTEPTFTSSPQSLVSSVFHGKTFFVAPAAVASQGIALYSIDANLVITEIVRAGASGYSGGGIAVDETDGSVYFCAKNGSDSTGYIYKWVVGSTSVITLESALPISQRPESVQIFDGLLYYLSFDNKVYRRSKDAGMLSTLIATLPTAAANSNVVSRSIRKSVSGKYHIYGAKAVLESSDLVNWTVTHTPNPYTGSQTTWFVTGGFDLKGEHYTLVRFDTGSVTKTAIYRLLSDGAYELLCPVFEGDCQGWGVAFDRVFLTSGYTSSPNRSLFSVVSLSGHVFIRKPCSFRFGVGVTAPFSSLGDKVLWAHSGAFAISDPITWIDALRVKGGWVMGG